MTQTSVADTLREYLSLLELLDDAYWEASSIHHKDMLYDIISIFSQEVAEINKLSIQDHHYPYEVITVFRYQWEAVAHGIHKLRQRRQVMTDNRDARVQQADRDITGSVCPAELVDQPDVAESKAALLAPEAHGIAAQHHAGTEAHGYHHGAVYL